MNNIFTYVTITLSLMAIANLSSAQQSPASATPAGDIMVYNNYDFVPGQTVMFEDNTN